MFLAISVMFYLMMRKLDKRHDDMTKRQEASWAEIDRVAHRRNQVHDYNRQKNIGDRQ